MWRGFFFAELVNRQRLAEPEFLVDEGGVGCLGAHANGCMNIALSDPPTRKEVQQMLDFRNSLRNQITRV